VCLDLTLNEEDPMQISLSENKYKPDDTAWQKYQTCKKQNMKKAQAQSFLNWKEIWQELNRVDRERLFKGE
jgi:hypothetical protein